MERLSKLVCENLMSGLWEGLWERIIMEKWNNGKKGRGEEARGRQREKLSTSNLEH